MATPKQLVQKIAEETGVSEATVIQHDRNLQLAGLRSKGGRGLAAAKVTYEDAANLLIAVAASRSVKDSVKTVSEYRDLVASDLLDFVNEKRGETLGDAIAALLEAVPKGRDLFGGRDGGEVVVSLFGPSPEAKISWRTRVSEGSIEYRGPRSIKFADLQFSASFSQVTLGFVGELIADDN